MIRNFIYSDSEKIRSISSQVFEGVSEHVALSKEVTSSESENQRGPIASGRLLGDIFTQTSSSTEMKFLEDFAYTLLEDKLESDNLFNNILSTGSDFVINKNFVKITAKLHINDLSASSKTLQDFNELGEAFWRVTNEPMNWAPGQKILSDGDAKKKAGEIGMQLNKKVTDSATRIINFGYGDLIEANMFAGKFLFSAPLKRKFLRESEQMILQKYSRKSQSDFIMLGLITYRGDIPEHDEKIPDVKDADGIKNAMRTLALHLRSVEKVYTAPASNEIIIDPVAIYSMI